MSPLSALQLRAPFTLTYRMAKLIQRSASGEKMSGPPEQRNVTISADGSSFIEITRDLDNQLTRVVVYSEGKTFAIEPTSTIQYAYPGFDTEQFTNFPIPGVGLPNLPLMKQTWRLSELPKPTAQVLTKFVNSESEFLSSGTSSEAGIQRAFGLVPLPDLTATNHTPLYTLGVIRFVIRAGVPDILTMYAPNVVLPSQVWQYSSPRLFQGAWVAGRIHMTHFMMRSVSQSFQDVTCDYTLASSSEQALSKENCDPRTYLTKNQIIDDYTARVAYQYYPNRGTLDQQLTRQQILDADSRANAKAGNINSRIKSGEFLMAALLCGGFALFLRRVLARVRK